MNNKLQFYDIYAEIQIIPKASHTFSCHCMFHKSVALHVSLHPQRSLGSALMTAGARLRELDLSDNAFGPDGVKGIETLLKSSVCHSLQELRLNNCGMGIGGGKVSIWKH